MSFTFYKNKKILETQPIHLVQGEDNVTKLEIPLSIDPDNLYHCYMEFNQTNGYKFFAELTRCAEHFEYSFTSAVTKHVGEIDMQLVLQKKDNSEIYKTMPITGKIIVHRSLNAMETGVNDLPEDLSKQILAIVNSRPSQEDLTFGLSTKLSVSSYQTDKAVYDATKTTVDLLEQNSVKKISQTLTSQEKTVARTNIGAASLLDVYPVGSIYMSVSSTSPKTLFGGEWTQIKDTFLLACGATFSNGATGGETAHTLTLNELPAHGNHLPTNNSEYYSTGSGGVYLHKSVLYSTSNEEGQKRGWKMYGGNEAYPEGLARGGGAAHNNMPPYLAVYMWKRTA